MIEYVAGFMFSASGTNVLLIRKARPTWQAGLLNGVGGKIELNEMPHQAMAREFDEETGIFHERWDRVAVLRGADWRVHFFRAVSDKIYGARKMTDETPEVHVVNALPVSTLPNIRVLVPLCLHALDADLTLPVRLADTSLFRVSA